ncbi:MAG: winged helix-turn-helix transcriptional regulator [Thermoplasmata archaeon]|nr:winged helix-turn-helix transcriptional regulator [Thermoplasmata archaeon]
MVDVGGLRVMTDPIGMEILDELGKGPANVSEIARRLNRPRPTVAYHLGNLERFRILKSEYRIIKEGNPKGRAARVYSIDGKVMRAYLDKTERLYKILEKRSK